ncbi:MAG TPA: ELM1/GtrOC1 family putative glycosyltransferase [Sphingomicrobium sp.]|nr:ELM1/GtrOC1 family putative glycosyltransferase [Sphingomicrobium sp.]
MREVKFPRIWVTACGRPGDEGQIYALAEELGLPFETRKLVFNRRFWRRSDFFQVTVENVDPALREKTLAPPWPDLLLLVGKRAVPVGRWIQKQSGGATRLVLIGHPRIPAEAFDLVFTTPQYPIPAGSAVHVQPVSMSRYRSPPKTTPEERAWLDRLPRPHLLMMLGGSTRYWKLAPRRIARIARKLASRAEAAGGSLIVVRSPRTSDDVVEEIERSLEGAACGWRVVRGHFPRFATLLSDADQLFPTADSVSMISESAITGKPVGIVPVEMTWTGRILLGRKVARANRKRDLRRFWDHILEKRIAGTIDDPVASDTPNPVIEAALEVRRLLEKSFGKLPG